MDEVSWKDAAMGNVMQQNYLNNEDVSSLKMKRTDQFVVVVQNILSSMRKTKMNLLRINLDLNMGTAWI